MASLAEYRKRGAHLSCSGLPSRSASVSVNSCTAGKSAASLNPSEGRFTNSLHRRGACPPHPLALIAQLCSFTAAGACSYSQLLLMRQ